MAAGDRRNSRYLYRWHSYDWAKSTAPEQSLPVTLPVVSAITARSATVTVGFTAVPVQAGVHRVVFGTRSHKYDRASFPVANVEGSTVAIPLRELLPATTYYLTDMVVPLPPSSDPLRGGAYRQISSAEVTFTTS